MAKNGLKSPKRVTTAWEHSAQYHDMLVSLEDARTEIETKSEALMDAYNAYDTIGWAPLTGDGYTLERGVPMESIKRWAVTNSQLVAINPLIKRAIRIRVSYIFGEGVEFKAAPRVELFIDKNADRVFSQQAYEEMETALGTDGSVFLLLDSKTQEITRVPFSEITNVACATSDKEKALYYQRTWSESRDGTTADPQRPASQSYKAWYPVPGFDGKKRESIGSDSDSAKVDHTKAMLHVTVNKQIGWLWGVPDIQPVVFWAKAYKEFLESNYTLVRALARFAWKVTGTVGAGTAKAAAKLASAPTLGPDGRPLTAGGAAVMGDGDLTAINKAGANVSFDAGRPLAAMVAAGLEVNLEHLINGSSSSNTGEQLIDPPTLKAMTTRQALWLRAFEKIFTYYGYKVKQTFPPIQSAPIHRLMQAITTAQTTNAIHPEEVRTMLLLALRSMGIVSTGTLPKKGAMAEFVTGINAAEQAQSATDAKVAGMNNNPGTSPQKSPDPSGVGASTGKSKSKSPAGAIADGDNSQRSSK